ncbi:peptidase M50B-like protein [Haloactinopolyspora alba]|uniref:Peptidase M50B-like protein n=1 Tax=Haloactinopolyspora alba TaxID=648780 RepID=A0A2P8E9B6_9ACTN|nr:M50 family metallopeptidase [Haloactinopolyspora alba]PSL06072.1 peptidase M50B-like protein [Haloactinopolyspora alba]
MNGAQDWPDRVGDWFDDVRVAETLSTMSAEVVAGIAVAAIVVALHPVTWRIVGYPVTIVHELGHVLAALTAGFRLRGVTVNGDMSGATNFSSHSALGTLWTMWWGYPAPSAVGLALIWAAANGWARLALGVLVVCLAFVFLLSRSWHTVGVVLLTGATFGLVGWYGSAAACTAVVFAFAWLLNVGGVRGLGAVLKSHTSRRGIQSSDAYMMSRQSAVPGGVWLFTFALAIGACAWFGVTMVLDALA